MRFKFGKERWEDRKGYNEMMVRLMYYGSQGLKKVRVGVKSKWSWKLGDSQRKYWNND
jgi:hypothetical protein